MCKITVDGYRMNDGSLIPFKNLDIQSIPVHHIEELNKTPATGWDIVLLRNSIEDIKQTLLNEQEKHIGCPVNKKEISKIVVEELKKIPERTLKRSSAIADNLTKILVFALTIVTIINMLK